MIDENARKQMVADIKEMWGDSCFLCDNPVWEAEGALAFSIDHWYPQIWCRQQGWTDEEVWAVENLRPAHRVCNTRKGEILPTDDYTVLIPVKEVKIKAVRPDQCDTCETGRLLFPGEFCPVCFTGPQPSATPKSLQRKPSECDHDKFICAHCFAYGIVERKSTFTF